MAHFLPDDTAKQPDQAGGKVSRRAVLGGAAGAGALAATGGLIGASAAEASTARNIRPSHESGGDPVVAHVHDVGSGRVDLYVGERMVSIHDRDLAVRLSRAAR